VLQAVEIPDPNKPEPKVISQGWTPMNTDKGKIHKTEPLAKVLKLRSSSLDGRGLGGG